MSRKRPNHPQTCAVHAPGDISCAGAPCPGFIYAAPPAPELHDEHGQEHEHGQEVAVAVFGPETLDEMAEAAALAQERVNRERAEHSTPAVDENSCPYCGASLDEER